MPRVLPSIRRGEGALSFLFLFSFLWWGVGPQGTESFIYSRG
nr:MAG TPA_asm: hypothetical protein [Caudoviricetes sp.]